MNLVCGSCQTESEIITRNNTKLFALNNYTPHQRPETHTHTHTHTHTSYNHRKRETVRRESEVPYKLLHTFLHRPAEESQSHPEGFVWRSPERPSSQKHTQQCSDHVCVCVCMCVLNAAGKLTHTLTHTLECTTSSSVSPHLHLTLFPV